MDEFPRSSESRAMWRICCFKQFAGLLILADFCGRNRLHAHRLGRRIAVLDPKSVDMADAAAIMTGAVAPLEMH